MTVCNRMSIARCQCAEEADFVIGWNSGLQYDHLTTNTSTANAYIFGTSATWPDLSATRSAGSMETELVGNCAAWWFGVSVTAPVTSAVWNTSVRVFKTVSDDASDRDAEFTLYGVDHDNWPLGNQGVSSQWWDAVAIKTTASVTVSSTATASTHQEVATSLDVTSIINEIVSRSGWNPGNNICFILVDDSEYEIVGTYPNDIQYGSGHSVRLFQTTLTIVT